MDMELKGKTVVVVGGSSNLGRSGALACAREGANVVIASRSLANVEKVVAQCEELGGGGQTLGVSFDATSLDDCENILVPTVLKQFGRIDSLVISMGHSQHADFLDIPVSDWKKTIDTNYVSMLSLIKSVLPVMIEQKLGNMVVMSSVLGRGGCAEESVYSGMKAAQINFFHSLVLAYSKYGLRFNIVAPALTLAGDASTLSDTSIWNGAFSEEDQKEMIVDFERNTPLGSIAKADDVGKAVLFFVSDAMSGHVTGNIIGTDGGMYMTR